MPAEEVLEMNLGELLREEATENRTRAIILILEDLEKEGKSFKEGIEYIKKEYLEKK